MKVSSWRRLRNTRLQTDIFAGIVAVGPSGMALAKEGTIAYENVKFHSCASYYRGDLLISDATIIYEIPEGTSENKIDMDVFDAATAVGGPTIVVAHNGEAIISKKEFSFDKYETGLTKISSINEYGSTLLISGLNSIKVLTYPGDGTMIPFSNRTITVSGVDFISAYPIKSKSLERIVALADNGTTLWIFDNYRMDRAYRFELNQILTNDMTINNIYVNNDDVYLLGSNGMICMIPNFDIEMAPEITFPHYEAMIAPEVNLKDMLVDNNIFYVCGEGVTEHSLVKTINLNNFIIAHDVKSHSIKGRFNMLEDKLSKAVDINENHHFMMNIIMPEKRDEI